MPRASLGPCHLAVQGSAFSVVPPLPKMLTDAELRHAGDFLRISQAGEAKVLKFFI